MQIQALKKEKENLALNYEQEEECLTNDLSRKLNQVSFFFRETHINPGNCVFVLKFFVTISIILNSENFREKKRKNIHILKFYYFSSYDKKRLNWNTL